MSRNTLLSLTTAVLALSATTLCATARADLKVVAKSTVEGAIPGPLASMAGNGAGNEKKSPKAGEKPEPTTTTITTYYRGTKVRTETKDSVTITDFSTGRTLILDPAKKTYRVEEAGKPNSMVAMFTDSLEFVADVTVKPDDATRTILGKTARHFVWALTLRVSAKPGSDIPLQGELFRMTMDGDQWNTPDIAQTGPSRFSQSGMAGFPSLAALLPDGMKAVEKKMEAIQGFALLSTLTTKFVSSLPGADPTKTSQLSDRTEVLSIRDAPLSDELFEAPKGYKKIETKMLIPGQ